MPRSATVISTTSGRSEIVTSTSVGGSEYLRALSMRLVITWSMRLGSASTTTGDPAISRIRSPTPASTNRAITSEAMPTRSVAVGWIGRTPAVSREMSSSSSTRAPSRLGGRQDPIQARLEPLLVEAVSRLRMQERFGGEAQAGDGRLQLVRGDAEESLARDERLLGRGSSALLREELATLTPPLPGVR